jgi:hypothetical protein
MGFGRLTNRKTANNIPTIISNHAQEVHAMKNWKMALGILLVGTTSLTACASSNGGSNSTGGAGGNTTGSGGGGGKGGSGGTIASGGSVGSGGTNASGGTVGSGGSGSGGATSPGGSGGSGGNVGAGGKGGATTGTGGNIGGNGGGTAGAGGTAVTGGTTGSGGWTGTGLPPLKVNGTKLQDPSGKTIVLRGSSLMDIGALYVAGGNNVKGISDRMDKLAAAGVQGHVVRFPVYPKIDYNAGTPYCSELPYPVGTGPTTSCTAKSPMTAADYFSKVLKPAVDYATSKNLYVIIDHHQIDDIIKGTSAADATTFWTDIAPKFADYNNVLYEPFNEPIDSAATWGRLKSTVQGWIDTIRKSAPNNIIIVPSNSYCQRPGDAASDPPTDPSNNLMYTAHVYPGNWNSAFKQQVEKAVAKAPVFFTEWGYMLNSSDSILGTSSTTWGTEFQAVVDGNGGSWTAWITDNGWTPNMFSDAAITKLTDFGTLAKTWLAAKATSDWVQ